MAPAILKKEIMDLKGSTSSPINLKFSFGTNSFSILCFVPINNTSVFFSLNFLAIDRAGYICPPVPPVVNTTFFILFLHFFLFCNLKLKLPDFLPEFFLFSIFPVPLLHIMIL